MEPTYEQYTVKCTKCEDHHPVECYREVRYYYCPKVEKILLLTEEKENEPK